MTACTFTLIAAGALVFAAAVILICAVIVATGSDPTDTDGPWWF